MAQEINGTCDIDSGIILEIMNGLSLFFKLTKGIIQCYKNNNEICKYVTMNFKSWTQSGHGTRDEWEARHR
jgi:hypothetical protein